MYGSFPPLGSDKHTRGKNQWSKSSVCIRLCWTKAKEKKISCVIFFIIHCMLLLLFHFGFLLLQSVWNSQPKACMCVCNIFCNVLFFQSVVWGKVSISVFPRWNSSCVSVNTITFPILWWILNNNNRIVRRKKYIIEPLMCCACVCAMKF